LEITANFIASIAPNAGAVSNGKALAGKFSVLNITADKTLLFGECKGSGKNPYVCSMDFIDPAAPVPRCTCPSRQYPCKHVIGLLYAYVLGKPFAESEAPESVLSKREGVATRAENKEKKKQKLQNEPPKPPTKAKITAASKKINMQIEGLDLAEKLLKNILRTGLSGLDARTRDALASQITQLGNYHIKGIQAAFNELFLCLKSGDDSFTDGITQVIFLRAWLKKAREHLSSKLQGDVLSLDTTSEIEAQIGHVWKLEELHALGCYLPRAELIQLTFDVVDNPAKKEYIDEGYHLCLQDGKIYATKNLRPYKAVKHINQDNTNFDMVVAEDMYYYPGGLNRRVRYDKSTRRELAEADYTAVQSYASEDFAETSKVIKNQLKTPLADKNPVALLKINNLSATADENYLLAVDSKGNQQLLKGETLPLLKLIDFNLLKDTAMLVSYENDIETGLLTAFPLSVIANDRIIRLKY